jgi:hypothetical protein
MSADAEMSAAIAAAAALEPTESDATESEPDASDVADTGNSAAAGEIDAAGEDADTDAASDDEDGEKAADDAVGVESLQSVGALFTDGDVAGACKLLGIDPKILNINVPKFEAMRKGLKEVKTREASALAAQAAAVQKEANAAAVVADAKKQYGQLVDLKLSLKKGDFYAAKEILEALAPDGTTYQQIAEGLAAAHKGTSPSEVAYRRKLRELAAKEAKDAEDAQAAKAKQDETAAESARVERNRAGATKLLKGTLFEGLPGAEDALIKLAADNWDPVKKGLKVPPAALVKLLAKDPLLGAAAELKRLKAGKPAAAPVVAPKVKVRTAPVVERDENGKFRNPRSGPKTDKVTAAENDRKAAIAEAARMEQAANRAARKGAR